MGKIIINGKEYGGSASNAVHIKYNNTGSVLISNNVQDAIDELKRKILKTSSY